MKKKIIIISIILFIVDQLTKILVKNSLINKVIIPGFLKLTYTQNDGVAFSLLAGKKILILIISLILICFIFMIINNDYIKKGTINNIKNIIYSMLLSGVFGNLFDRIIRGYVIDFISINIFGYSFPVFNVADILITISVVMIILDVIFDKKRV